jgi:hypothetical protein
LTLARFAPRIRVYCRTNAVSGAFYEKRVCSARTAGVERAAKRECVNDWFRRSRAVIA